MENGYRRHRRLHKAFTVEIKTSRDADSDKSYQTLAQFGTWVSISQGVVTPTLLSSSFMVNRSLTRQYFFGSRRIKYQTSSNCNLPVFPTSKAFEDERHKHAEMFKNYTGDYGYLKYGRLRKGSNQKKRQYMPKNFQKAGQVELVFQNLKVNVLLCVSVRSPGAVGRIVVSRSGGHYGVQSIL
uniref:Uncharacterized protein n=1 Tax=Romanomermis culicivorax TaxID=13658 RepID=A0A915KDF6_ROMCU